MKLITATLDRTHHISQTLGAFVAKRGDKTIFECDTIELPWMDNKPQISCIPEGVYTVVYRESKKYPQHYHILKVPNRDFILIHQANFVGSLNPKTRKPDLLGCIGVGDGYNDITGDGVVELLKSNPTLKKMIAAIGKNSFQLTIR